MADSIGFTYPPNIKVSDGSQPLLTFVFQSGRIGWLPSAGPPLRFDILTLAVVSFQQTPKGKVLIQVGPVDAIRRNLDATQLFDCSICQPRILGNWTAGLG